MCCRRVKWYQAVRLVEEAQTLRDRATVYTACVVFNAVKTWSNMGRFMSVFCGIYKLNVHLCIWQNWCLYCKLKNLLLTDQSQMQRHAMLNKNRPIPGKTVGGLLVSRTCLPRNYPEKPRESTGFPASRQNSTHIIHLHKAKNATRLITTWRYTKKSVTRVKLADSCLPFTEWFKIIILKMEKALNKILSLSIEILFAI